MKVKTYQVDVEVKQIDKLEVQVPAHLTGDSLTAAVTQAIADGNGELIDEGFWVESETLLLHTLHEV